MRKCSLTGKRRNNGMQVSHSHIRTRKIQLPNLQTKRIWLETESRFVVVTLSTSALRTVTKKGLAQFLRDEGKTLRDIT